MKGHLLMAFLFSMNLITGQNFYFAAPVTYIRKNNLNRNEPMAIIIR